MQWNERPVKWSVRLIEVPIECPVLSNYFVFDIEYIDRECSTGTQILLQTKVKVQQRHILFVVTKVKVSLKTCFQVLMGQGSKL